LILLLSEVPSEPPRPSAEDDGEGHDMGQDRQGAGKGKGTKIASHILLLTVPGVALRRG